MDNNNSSSPILIFISLFMTVVAVVGWYFYQQSNQLVSQLNGEINTVKKNLNNKTNQVYELLDKQQQIKNKEDNTLKSYQSQIKQLNKEKHDFQQTINTEKKKIKTCQASKETLNKQISLNESKLTALNEEISSLKQEYQDAVQQQNDSINLELNNCKNESNDLIAKIQQYQEQLKTSEIQAAANNKELQHLKNELEKNKQLVQHAQRQLKKKINDAKLIQSQLKNQIKLETSQKNKNNEIVNTFVEKLKEYQVNISGISHNGVLISIQSDQLFNGDSYQITKKGADLLTIIAEQFKEYPEQAVEITGHTDNHPAKKHKDSFIVSNWELSSARAAAIIRLFQFRTKINPYRMSLVGASQYQPIAQGNSEKSRTTNRRIELRLLPH